MGKKPSPPSDSRWKTITQLRDHTGLSKTTLKTQLRKVDREGGVWRRNPAIVGSRLYDTEHPLVAAAVASAHSFSNARKGTAERVEVSPLAVTGEFYMWWETVFRKTHLLRYKTWKWRGDEDLPDD